MTWLAAQDWCDGQIGMWGTSYSGFNSLQMACEQPPELKAICAIYATDDRWTDDVHWRGGALRLVDLVDYCHYMTAMNVLPPVPAVWGEGWEREWHRRLETHRPWVLTWLREGRHGDYWRGGSVRLGPDGQVDQRLDVLDSLVVVQREADSHGRDDRTGPPPGTGHLRRLEGFELACAIRGGSRFHKPTLPGSS